MSPDVVYWIRGQEFADLARVSIESVRKVYGNRAQVFVYTDDPALRTVEGATVLCRLAPGEPAMVANLTAQVRHLTTSQHGQRVLFLDADTIVRKPFPFDDDHDLIVTWRDHERVTNGEKIAGVAAMMPYNYGVIGARVSPASIEAFMAMRASVLRMSVQYRNWYGNQLALADLVGAPPKQGERSVVVPIRWSPMDAGNPIMVKQLPCEEWNFTPESEGEDVSGKGILHMKGRRKALMAHYSRAA